MPDNAKRPAPTWFGDGIPSFQQRVHWLTLDSVRGRLLARSLKAERSELLCVIVHACQVRVMTAPGGNVICGSDDRDTANHGRCGKQCSLCEQRGHECRLRWRIWIKEVESDILFAHTLSITGSAGFACYMADLQHKGRLPPEVVTEIYIEEFVRKRTGLSYRRLQFACASPA